MKKLIFTTATVLCIGLIAFAYESGKRTTKSGLVKKCMSVNESSSKWPDIALHQYDLPQELKYGIQSKNSIHIKKEQLKDVKLINDIISDYPLNWISSYVSVEISAVCGGKKVKGISSNNVLSTEQINMLNSIDMNTDMVIDVNYTYETPVTKTIEKNTMHVLMTVVPEVEAEYAGGKEQMVSYLNDHINKFFKTRPEQFQQATIRFTVNEEGNITNAKISNSTGYDQIYIVLLDAIYKMPKWKPAENPKGVRVKQEFEFTVGRYGC